MQAIATGLPLFARAMRSQAETLVVRRFDDGRWVRAAKSFTSEELPDRDAVRARFGGGRYEVIGRANQRIVARTRFVLDGASLPLEEPEAKASPKRATTSGLRRFATSEGEREGLVFKLLREGLSIHDITEQTGIESRVVRAIYLAWITPAGASTPTTPEEIAERAHQTQQRVLERELAAWDRA